MAGQVIGAVGSENQGLTGLEAGEESVLSGSDGERRIVSDALGDPIRLETVKEAEDGEDIQLTLDPLIQEKTERVLAEVGETYSPKGATAIVVDPRSSQILAMANWPPVDPNDLSSASNEDLRQQGDRLQLRAGLDLQGVHRLRRAGGKTGDAGHRIHAGAEHPGRRPDDRRRRGTRHRNDERRPRSSPTPRTSARSRSGSRSAPRNSATGSTASASAARPGSSSRPRSRGSCPSSTNTRARRWATCRSARASR